MLGGGVMFRSDLALEGLVSHCELDEGTGTAGHLLTGLQKKKGKRVTRQTNCFLRIIGDNFLQTMNIMGVKLFSC